MAPSVYLHSVSMQIDAENLPVHPMRLLVAEDHAVVRAGMVALVELDWLRAARASVCGGRSETFGEFAHARAVLAEVEQPEARARPVVDTLPRGVDAE